MKALPLSIQTTPVTEPGSYDQNKPFYSKRIAIRPDPVESINAVGILPNQFYDVIDDTGVVNAVGQFATPNGRLFVSQGFTTSVLTVAMYSFNTTTGAKGAWLGSLKFTFAAAATNTLKSMAVDDTNPSSMIFTFTSTHTTATNGGLFGVWGVPTTDFVTSSFITYPYATTVPSLNKVVYKNVDVIGTNGITTAVGHDFDNTSGGTISDYYVFNNTAALPKIFKFSMSAPPSGTVTAGEANSNFTYATGTFTALTGTIVSGGSSVRIGKLVHTANSGSACLTYLTSTNIYASKLSDITNGATSFPSQQTTTTSLDINKFANAFLIPTITFGTYDQFTDRFYLMTSTGKFLSKQIVNNDPNGAVFGGNDAVKGETGTTGSPEEMGSITNVGLCSQNGWLFLNSTSVGQRGLVQMDVASDKVNGLSFVLSPVITISGGQAKMLAIFKALSKRSVSPTISYRTSNFSVDPNAGLPAFYATFTTVSTNTGDLSALSGASQAQFLIQFTNMGLSNTNASQIIELYLLLQPLNEISDYWSGSVDNTTGNGISPAYSAFRLNRTYITSVPTLYFRAYDDAGSLVASANTASNPTLFKYSTNNGSSWNALGTIPNTALTTELRYEWASPPGVNVSVSLRES